MLEKKGFRVKWRRWIPGCLNSMSYSIMINGNPKGKFTASRGLKKGGPLSLHLFTIAVNVLSKLITRAVEVSLIKPLSVGRTNFKISQLQFADDSLFSNSLEEESLSNLSTILDIFCLISGLKVNLEKSIIFRINLKSSCPLWLESLGAL